MDVPEHRVMAQGYIEEKARRCVETGLDRRAEMWLASQGSNLVPAVLSGMRQIADGNGFSPESPLEGIGISAFYRMLAIIGFRCQGQMLCDTVDGCFLDRMVMKHQVTGMVAHLYNLVEIPLMSSEEPPDEER
jgi:hypothetical protein